MPFHYNSKPEMRRLL